MYIPKVNLTTDTNEIVAFMQRFSFATLVSSKQGVPVATHLPFLVKLIDNKVILYSHFAKANDHWHGIENEQPLVIFNEPHAYISTGNYDKELNVPTWNYIAVHAYGNCRLLSEPAQALEIIDATIEVFESSYKLQWDSFPADYRSKMLNGIVAFEIEVTALQGKKKLSQNRSDSEKSKIITNLSSSQDHNEQQIAQYMSAEPGK